MKNNQLRFLASEVVQSKEGQLVCPLSKPFFLPSAWKAMGCLIQSPIVSYVHQIQNFTL